MRKCKRCLRVKVLRHFKPNPTSKDGISNICTLCNIKYSRKERLRKRNLLVIMAMRDPERKKEIMRRYLEKYPEKKQAGTFCERFITVPKGFEKHHWSYNKIHWLSVFVLSIEDHAYVHRFIMYDPTFKMYYDSNLILLRTKKAHKAYIFKLLKDRDSKL